jgi:hypothetical protein
MDRKQFDDLHTGCLTALANYVSAAEQTAAMLEKCTPEPMPFRQRLDLLVQERDEEQAHTVYLDTKRVLREAAKLGYYNTN